MFSNLIESGSHGRDLKRKGTFFLGTLVTYGVLLAAAGVGSIYAYNVTLEDRNDYEVLAVMDFSRAREERVERAVKPSAASKPAGGGRKAQQPVAVIEDLVVENPNGNRQVAPEGARKLPPGMRYEFGNHTNIPTAANFGGGNEEGDGEPGGKGKDTGPLVEEKGGEGPPRMAKAAPTPAPTPKQEVRKIVQLSSGVISSKATSKPAPPYPLTAKMSRVQGPVTVQIVVDEQGRVVSAKATTGHPLLRLAAEQAAYQARFTPTLLSGHPVKVTGMMTYNFVLH